MSVARARREISATEFYEWQAYYELEPFGEERADLRAGIIAATIANVHRGKRSRPYKPSDFMPEYEPRKDKPWQEMRAVMKSYAKAHNAHLEQQQKKSKQ